MSKKAAIAAAMSVLKDAYETASASLRASNAHQAERIEQLTADLAAARAELDSTTTMLASVRADLSSVNAQLALVTARERLGPLDEQPVPPRGARPPAAAPAPAPAASTHPSGLSQEMLDICKQLGWDPATVAKTQLNVS